MRILFITSTRIGDAILSTGLLSWLIETYPGARITVACGPEAAPLFAHTPNVERVHVMHKARRSAHWFTLWRATAGTVWDIVVDLRASALTYFLIAKERHILGRASHNLHRVMRSAELFDLYPPPAPTIWPGEEALAAAAGLVPGDGRKVLAIGPTANWIGKQWPAERFLELARRLTGTQGPLSGARLMLLGGPSERGMAQPIIDAFAADDLIDLVGKTDLLTAYACLERADLYVGNDSGLMHLAAAAGVPTLGLFGPSREEHYAPWGAKTAFVRGAASYEEIVGRADYDPYAGVSYMESLSVDRVEAAALGLLERQARAEPRLSALVVAHNEEKNLPECLACLDFADEVVVVLDKCTDGSRDAALAAGARIIEGSWELEGDRRNQGIAACTGDWIVEIDADERASRELGTEIRDTIRSVPPGWYHLPFRNYIGGKYVRYGWGAYNGVNSAPRLFARGCKHWGNQRVHPRVTLSGVEGWLRASMDHYVDRDITDMIARLNSYSSAHAADMRASGELGTLRSNIRRLFSRFWQSYVARKGYREGRYGLLLALFAALYPILSYLKATLDQPGPEAEEAASGRHPEPEPKPQTQPQTQPQPQTEPKPEPKPGE